MKEYQLKSEISFDALMPIVMAINTLLATYGGTLCGRYIVELLETIFENPDDVDRFFNEVKSLGQEELNNRLLQFYSS